MLETRETIMESLVEGEIGFGYCLYPSYFFSVPRSMAAVTTAE